MKKYLFLIYVLVFMLVFSGCRISDYNKSSVYHENSKDVQKIDIDFTKLSKTVIYSEVSNMTTNPEAYIGKRIRMSGKFTAITNPSHTKIYNMVVVADATACCSQGFEFVLKENQSYLEKDADITVVGTYDTYYEGESMHYQLINAILEA